jgi:phosphoglycolate phosphatase
MPIEAVIFDLDGTLADTLEDIGVSMNEPLRQLDQPTHPLDSYRAFVGEGVQRLAETALPPGRSDLVPEAVSRFRAHYAAHIVDHTRAFAEVPAMLDVLAGRGLPMAVLSNKIDAMTRRIVDLCFSRWGLRPVYGERPGVPKKPDPTSALEIARELGVLPERMAFVGDTSVDMFTAHNAGMYAVGALWGFRTRDEIEGAGADVVIAHPGELPGVLDRASPSFRRRTPRRP